MIRIKNLTVDSLNSPLGIGNLRPAFGWQMESDERKVSQKAARILVKDAETEEILWDTGIEETTESTFILYKGKTLSSRQRCSWKVMVWDEKDIASSWSEESSFEMGLLAAEDWTAKWIEPAQLPVEQEPPFNMMTQLDQHDVSQVTDRLHPCPVIRKVFALDANVRKARIYATAHGLYRCQLNGKRVGDIELTPGFTSYKKFLQVQTYDVKELVQEGSNELQVLLADGWYAGRIGMTGDSCQFGNQLSLLLQMEVEYEDGKREIIGTDTGFESGFGPLCYSDLYIGEKTDLRKKIPDGGWTSVRQTEETLDNLRPQIGEPVRVVEERTPAAVLTSPKGECILDFGQVLAGRVSMQLEGPSGTEIILEHSEVLDKEGNFLNNIVGRNKDQKDVFILSGKGRELLCPTFTFHGFRYVKVTGYSGTLTIEMAKAQVLSSDMASTGSFFCSDERINRLQENIRQSQRGNMISIPTDCPQRERAGWTGDLQIFTPTACFNRNMYAFLDRWLLNARLEQFEDGGIPNIVPYIPSYNIFAGGAQMPGSAGWGDAAVIVPYQAYRYYGDKEILERNYNMMKRWVEYMRHCAEENCQAESESADVHRKYLWNNGQNLGDWLIPSIVADPSPANMMKCSAYTQEQISSCFYAYSTSLLAETAEILGKTEDADEYRTLAGNIRKAFAEEYLKEDGYLGDYQGMYVMALYCRMIPEQERKNVAAKLASLIAQNGNRLDTGFVSTPFLLDVLMENGYKSLAWTVFMQTDCPSWLYEVEHGATTIWESWNAILADGTPLPVSYNHYAFGCVGDWMYRNIAGIELLTPGFKKMILHPNYTCGQKAAGAEHESPYGRISIRWEIKEDTRICDIQIPVNTEADLILEDAEIRSVLESGLRPEQQDILTEVSGKDLIYHLGSGNYHFSYTPAACNQ